MTVLVILVSTKNISAAGFAEMEPGVSEGRSLDSDALEKRGLRNRNLCAEALPRIARLEKLMSAGNNKGMMRKRRNCRFGR